jgi:hypothetical protein
MRPNAKAHLTKANPTAFVTTISKSYHEGTRRGNFAGRLGLRASGQDGAAIDDQYLPGGVTLSH